MPTRFYFSSIGTPTQAPTVDASWERTAGFVRRKLHLTKETGQALTNITLNKGVATNPADVLMHQAISPPLRAGSISGTVKSIIQASCNTPVEGTRSQLLIRVFSGNLLTVRGTLLAHNTGVLSNDFTSTITNRKFPLNWTSPGESLSSVSAEEGDVIVIEIGSRMYGTLTAPTFTLRFGNNNSLSDLSENETDTADGIPWIEFSQDLLFLESSDKTGQFSSISSFDPPMSLGTSNALYSYNALSNGLTFEEFPTSSLQNIGTSVSNTKLIKKYLMFATNTIALGGYITWVNTTGDDTNKPNPGGITGATRILNIFYE